MAEKYRGINLLINRKEMNADEENMNARLAELAFCKFIIGLLLNGRFDNHQRLT